MFHHRCKNWEDNIFTTVYRLSTSFYNFTFEFGRSEFSKILFPLDWNTKFQINSEIKRKCHQNNKKKSFQ
jgi:hypothetical protein